MGKTPEELLQERKKRIMDTIALKVPDRVPLYLPIGIFGTKYAGMAAQEAFDPANTEEWFGINEKLLLEYEPDFFLGPNTVMDDAKPELVRAWVDATRKYGNY